MFISLSIFSIFSITSSAQAPKCVKIFINLPRSMDFDDAERSEPTQTLELSEEDYKDEGLMSLRYVKFQNVNSVTVCFSFSCFCHTLSWNFYFYTVSIWLYFTKFLLSLLSTLGVLSTSGEMMNNMVKSLALSRYLVFVLLVFCLYMSSCSLSQTKGMRKRQKWTTWRL